jgi:hypothetical protein
MPGHAQAQGGRKSKGNPGGSSAAAAAAGGRPPAPAAGGFLDSEALEQKRRALTKEKNELACEEKELAGQLDMLQRELQSLKSEKSALGLARDLAGAAGETPTTPNPAFAAEDRRMELELLNTALQRGQATDQAKVAEWEKKLVGAREDLEKAQRRLAALPKCFTQSADEARATVAALMKEKDALREEMMRQRAEEVKKATLDEEAAALLRKELDAVLDEIDEVETQRDSYARRMKAESAQVAALADQRETEMAAVRKEFGSDAIERAIFISTARGAPVAPSDELASKLHVIYAPEFSVGAEDLRSAASAGSEQELNIHQLPDAIALLKLQCVTK